MNTLSREGIGADAIDGVVPRHVVRPESPDELSRALAGASRDRHSTVLRGGGTKIEWGRSPASVDLVVETAGLARLVAHRHGDMTATAQAGMPLMLLNRHLAEQGQYLPVDSAFHGATIGGMIATNDCGPLRHRFGTPRDLLIGITLAMADGRLVKAGGTVVKNVAGYDLGKLVSGSFGTLAAIVDATFKLLPLPRASRTLVSTYMDGSALARDVAALNASQVELTSFDVHVSDKARFQLLMRMASSGEATEAMAAEASRLLSSPASILTGDDEQAFWAEQVRAPWSEGGTIVRLSWLPANLSVVLASLDELRRHGCRPSMFTGRTIGAGLLRLEGDDRACAAAITDLRSRSEVGHVVVLRASRRLKEQTDVWGGGSDRTGPARALKRMFDPQGILNAGRGPI
ncbi:MAG TPA: FAD-binding oxidoreductase [Vicinamibacterales bacterium]|nr:FAD-binding oxidoreductase [Vicinamibacterales bacterium]